MYKKRQRLDLLYYNQITMGVGQDWDAASYDETVNTISDLPLDLIIKSASIIVEVEVAPDIDIAYQILLHQGDNVTLGDDDSITDMLEQGNNYEARISWLPDNIIVFLHPYLRRTAEYWIAETQDVNMFCAAENFIALRQHFEESAGADNAPTQGTLQLYLILEVEVL